MSRGAKGDETMTKALARFLAQRLVPDLKERARTPSVAEALRHRWEHERDARRTADLYDPWAARLVEQVGAAWILSCAFVRTLEDRGYLAHRRLAGPGAVDSEHYFFELFPQLGARDYLLAVFREMGHLPGAADLFGPDHNAAWRLAPSNPVAQELLALWRSTTEERAPTWTFEGTDTRFLGDLYQWLSEDARERFALLQTPDFVEEFILDLTLDPAIEEFGLEAVRLIDPTCGSGHFLLGAFERLFERRAAAKPGLERRAHALAALSQVHGVDINPYAVEIARFRLTLSFLEKAGIERIADAPALKTNLVVADSLLHGARYGNLRLSDLTVDRHDWGDTQFTLEDETEARRILGQRYHAVVGNPPYITCKDAVLREHYRELYPKSAAGKFALAAPFTERFFQLGVEGGFVGLINANSFMKREFGKKLIEEVLPRLDLTHVLDTAGAYIPGHGTPTVILAGRSRPPVCDMVRVAMGTRGEPETPADPANALVWSSIARHVNERGFENEFISVTDVSRDTLARHPWSLGGGGAAELKEKLETEAKRLSQLVEDIGFASFIGLDDAFMMPPAAARSQRLEREVVRPIIVGEWVRDWAAAPAEIAITPYSPTTHEPIPFDERSRWGRFLWPFRSTAEGVASFGGKTRKCEGQNWWEWYRWQKERYDAALRITFAFVATHNHFVLERGGNVFSRSAPIIILRAGATEDDYLALLGYLNSSTACFWIKQVAQPKTVTTGDKILQPDLAKVAIEITGGLLQNLPVFDAALSDSRVREAARALDRIAKRRTSREESLAQDVISADDLATSAVAAGEEDLKDLRRAVALQEALDSFIYLDLGLVPSEFASDLRRAAERVLKTDIAFDADHRAFGCMPRTDVELVRVLRDATNGSAQLQLIEAPNYKRRWMGVQGRFNAEGATWDVKVRAALTEWLLDRAEEVVALSEAPLCVSSLGDRLWALPNVPRVAGWLRLDTPDAMVSWQPLSDEAVPYLSTFRFTPSGLEKRLAWERTWELQRLEDASEPDGKNIPVPRKYDSKDYAGTSFWRLRGKLDVPKERFISYPGAERDGDKSLIIGCAGWDHLQRAQALAAIYEERKTEDGWPKERLVPLLAGILELVPWLKQWHNEPNPDFGDAKLGDYFEGYVTSEASALGVTLDELRAWKPEPAKSRRGRKPTKAKETT